MIIETDKLCKRYANVCAVTDLNLNVPEGSVYALFGPNAAGKTTTLKMLMNLVAPTSGVARVLGCPSRQLGPSELGRIAYVSENQRLPEGINIQALFEYGRALYPDWDQAALHTLIRKLNLDPAARVDSLSRGTRMKVALAFSLAYHPRLMVFDEPFAGLDPAARGEVVEGLLSQAGGGTGSAIIATHDIDEVDRVVDRVGILHRGRLVLDEDVGALLGRFRRVVARIGAPGKPWSDWLCVECAAPGLSFVESRFDPNNFGDRVRAAFPDATHVDVAPMTLKEIFVALALAPVITP